MSNPFFPTFNKNDLIKGLNDRTGYVLRNKTSKFQHIDLTVFSADIR